MSTKATLTRGFRKFEIEIAALPMSRVPVEARASSSISLPNMRPFQRALPETGLLPVACPHAKLKNSSVGTKGTPMSPPRKTPKRLGVAVAK